MDSSREKDHAVTESLNQTHQQTKSLEDIMYQRMKNRERQRRYRERKRLQADMNNKSVRVNEPTPPSLPLPPPPSSAIVPYQNVTRVRCTRDWKKDARRAHHTAKQETADVTHGIQVSEHKSKNDIPANPSGLENGEKSKMKSIRRDWKAEARSKKGESN